LFKSNVGFNLQTKTFSKLFFLLDIVAMKLKTKVMVSHITSLSEARYCAGMGVDFLGFPFWYDYKDDFKQFIDISTWISGPSFVIECLGKDNLDRVLAEKIAAEYIQAELDEIEPAEVGDYKLFILLPESLSEELIDKLRSMSGKGHSVITTQSGMENYGAHLAGFAIFMIEGPEEWQESLDVLLGLPIDGIITRGDDEEETPGILNYDRLSDVLQQLQVNED
jgi:phosphoribosylanthranilate isomerase